MFLRIVLMAWLLSSATLAALSASPLKAVLKFDKPSFYLGEPILAHVGWVNEGQEPVDVESGGDYRGVRELRYKVTATDAKGNAVPDPYTSVICMGGMMGADTISPGKTLWWTIPLLQYLDFSQPGTYTVRVTHDLGWGGTGTYLHDHLPTGATPPVAEATITLRRPTPQEARTVLAQLRKLPPNTFRINTDTPYADFTVLRDPVYLPLLLSAAQQGEKWALDGVASIITPEATQALLDLLDSPRDVCRSAARQSLLARLPVQLQYWSPQVIRDLPRRAWRNDLIPTALNRAWRSLGTGDVEFGSSVLASFGSQHEMDRLVDALDQALALQNDALAGALAQAASTLYTHGVTWPTGPRTPGRAVLLMAWLNGHPQQRPEGWQETALWMLEHPSSYVRQAALRGMPVPLEEDCVRPVLDRLLDGNPRVQEEACKLAARAKDPRFGARTLEVLTRTKDSAVASEAEHAAARCGVTSDRWVAVCIDRLDEPPINETMLKILTRIVIYDGGITHSPFDAATGRTLQASWRRFFDEHRAELQAGTRYPAGAPPLTADLFAPAYVMLQVKDDHWPLREVQRGGGSHAPSQSTGETDYP